MSPPTLKSILLIDDDEISNLFNKIFINKLDLELQVDVALNGSEAIELLKGAVIDENFHILEPCLRLLDIRMPVMDGWDFLKRFTEIKAQKDIKTTLYIVSSSIDPFEIEKARADVNVTDYLIKPVNLDEFEALFSKSSA